MYESLNEWKGSILYQKLISQLLCEIKKLFFNYLLQSTTPATASTNIHQEIHVGALPLDQG